MVRVSMFSENAIAMHHMIPIQIHVKKSSMRSRDGSDRSVDQVTTMCVVFFKGHPEPIWVPAVITFHDCVLMYPVLAISILEETVVLAIHEVVVHSCVKARVWNPTVGKKVERTA
jgi:hypothetical protein